MLSFLISLSSLVVAVTAVDPWQNTSLPISLRVSDLVSRLTLEEKVANLDANFAPGAPRIGLTPYRYDEECMRGATTSGVSLRPLGTGVPTLLALAGTFNVSLLASIGLMSAREVRAYYNIDRRTANLTTTANCYAPVVNIVRDPKWGRAAEMATGEDGTLGRIYSRAWTAAMRGGGNDTSKLVTSVCKHLATYGGPEDSRMTFVAELEERNWRETYLPAFRGAAEAGADAFMCSYTSVTLTDAPEKLTRTPDCASNYLLNTIVRGEFNWTGWITSDATALHNMVPAHNGSLESAAISAITNGCDMELTCCNGVTIYNTLTDAVNGGRLAVSFIDTAVSRVLTGRFASGNLNPPSESPWARLNESDIYSNDNLALAKEAARASVVLLANTPQVSGGLPWNRSMLINNNKVLCVIGPLANATQDFMGGYTSIPRPGDIISPVRAFTEALNQKNVVYIEGCVDGLVCTTLQPNLATALGSCDAIVAIVGTSAYAPRDKKAVNAAHEGEGVDRDVVTLAGKQGQVLTAALATQKSVVIVIASGGMVDVRSFADGASALLAAPFGGQFAGDAIAAVVFGDENPAARLTTTWYKTNALARLSDISNYSMIGRTYKYAAPDAARFPFGHGLSYSNFTYSGLTISPSSPSPCDIITITATLTNMAGGPNGAEVSQLYTSFPQASVSNQPLKSLVNWEKVFISSGSSTILTLTITPEDNIILRDGDFVPVIEPGLRTLWLGASSSSSDNGGGLAGTYTVTGAITPLSQCYAAGSAPVTLPTGVAHVWPPPILGEGGGAARWVAKE